VSRVVLLVIDSLEHRFQAQPDLDSKDMVEWDAGLDHGRDAKSQPVLRAGITAPIADTPSREAWMTSLFPLPS
jgi:hypothetical protein